MRSGILSRAVGYADLARHAGTLKRSTDDAVRQNARIHLAQRMGKLRGLPQKMGQILSMSDDEERAAAFAPLGDNAEPMPFQEIRPLLEEAWRGDIDAVVLSIDQHGLAASLGQVHRAVLRDGREVAVKVQYPGVRKAVMNDLKALGWLSASVGDLRRGFDLADYRAEILRDLEEELDYRAEAGYQRRYGEMLRDLPEWIVPEVVPELSNERVLVTHWETGRHIDDAARLPQQDRDALGLSLIRGFFRMLFHHGHIHSDPHPGNYRFATGRTGPKIILYDYGSVATVTTDRRVALLKLIEICRNQSGNPYKPFLALGFSEILLEPISGKLAALCRILFEPFWQQGKYDLSTWRLSERVDDILGDDRWNFRMSGPASLIFLMRAFRGLTYYLERLDTRVSWYAAVAPHLTEHQEALERFHVSDPPAQGGGSFDSLARHLKIRVTHHGATKVALTFPGTSVDNLSDLMDAELMSRLTAQGIDIDAIVRDVRRGAYQPRTLFTLEETQTKKGVSVWLE